MDDFEAAGSGGLRSSLARFSGTALGLLRTRLELASVELAEERQRLELRIALAFAGVLALLFGVMTTGALVVIWFWETNRYAAVGGLAVLLLVAGALLLLKARSVGRGETPFATTLAELEKDRQWLAGAARERDR